MTTPRVVLGVVISLAVASSLWIASSIHDTQTELGVGAEQAALRSSEERLSVPPDLVISPPSGSRDRIPVAFSQWFGGSSGQLVEPTRLSWRSKTHFSLTTDIMFPTRPSFVDAFVYGYDDVDANERPIGPPLASFACVTAQPLPPCTIRDDPGSGSFIVRGIGTTVKMAANLLTNETGAQEKPLRLVISASWESRSNHSAPVSNDTAVWLTLVA